MSKEEISIVQLNNYDGNKTNTKTNLYFKEYEKAKQYLKIQGYKEDDIFEWKLDYFLTAKVVQVELHDNSVNISDEITSNEAVEVTTKPIVENMYIGIVKYKIVKEKEEQLRIGHHTTSSLKFILRWKNDTEKLQHVDYCEVYELLNQNKEEENTN
tara:strand:+ start:343 stop:810 length:468 start_codon:yes stop_codon:yes gene_type:complete